VNRGLPIPNGHEQKLQSQQQSRTSLLLTSSRIVNKVQAAAAASRAFSGTQFLHH